MKTRSFLAQQAELEEACEFLRSFTLGRQGVTLKDGAMAIERVNAQCERMKRLFGCGPHAQQTVTVVASARARVAAAEARQALLAKRG